MFLIMVLQNSCLLVLELGVRNMGIKESLTNVWMDKGCCWLIAGICGCACEGLIRF